MASSLTMSPISAASSTLYFESKLSVEGDTLVRYIKINPDYFRTLVESTISKEPIHLVFTVDVSGSMSLFAKDSLKTKIDTVVDGIKECLQNIVVFSEFRNIYISIITFDHNAVVIVDNMLLTNASIADLLVIVTKKVVINNGSTAIEKALQVTEHQITKVGLSDTFVFFLTDGQNSNKEIIPTMVSNFSTSLNRTKYFGVGIGQSSDYDVELLNSLFVEMGGYPTAVDIQSAIIGKMFQQFTNIFNNVIIKPTLETIVNFDISTTLVKIPDHSYNLSKFELGQIVFFAFRRKTTSNVKPHIQMQFMLNGTSSIVNFCSDIDSSMTYAVPYTMNYINALDDYDTLMKDFISATHVDKLSKIKKFVDHIIINIPPESSQVRKYYDVLLADVNTLKTNISGGGGGGVTPAGMASLLLSSVSAHSALRTGTNIRTTSMMAGLVSTAISSMPPDIRVTTSTGCGEDIKDDKFTRFDPTLLRIPTT
jgi:uncharacterized protein YegL